MFLTPFPACDHFFAVVNLAILKGPSHRAVDAGLLAVFVGFVTGEPHAFAKILLKPSVGVAYLEVFIQHCDVTGCYVEKGSVFLLKTLDLGNVGEHYLDGRNISRIIPDWRSVCNDTNFFTVFKFDNLFTGMALPVLKGHFHRTDITLFRTSFDDIETGVTFATAEFRAKHTISGYDFAIPVLNRDIPRHFIEQLTVKIFHLFLLIQEQSVMENAGNYGLSVAVINLVQQPFYV
jgi:hypothetical protein